jgi:hypothetical protein
MSIQKEYANKVNFQTSYIIHSSLQSLAAYLPEVQRTPVENHCPTEIQFV